LSYERPLQLPAQKINTT